MKVLLMGESYDTRKTSIGEIQTLLQKRADAWLGTNTITVEVNQTSSNQMEFVIRRKYGSYYEDPDSFKSPGGQFIFSYDQQIILGTDYQTGTKADFSQHPGRYLICDAVEDFEYDYKQAVRENHASRVKNIQFEEHLEWCKLTVNYV